MKRSLTAILTLLIPVTAFAATFQVANEDDELFSVNVPVRDDLYVAGGLVHVKETVGGDLIIAGGEVTITGDIKEDVIGAGGKIEINGTVGDDVRVAGGDIVISGTVTDDLIVAGGNVRITKDAIIQGDAFVFGGMLLIDGAIKGNLKSAGGNVILSGKVWGDADINSEEFQMEGSVGGNIKFVSKGLTVGGNANVGGDADYWTDEDDSTFKSIVGGSAFLNPDLKGKEKDISKATYMGALKIALLAFVGFALLSGALIILILVWSTNSFFKEAAKKIEKSSGGCLVTGLLYFVMVPVVGLLLLISIIGIPIAFFMFVMYGFVIFFAKALTAVVFAQWFVIYNKKKWGKVGIFFMSLLIFVLLKVISLSVPFIGWLAVLLLVLMAIGAIAKTKMEVWKKYS
ncbi:hypothetical protein KJ652_01625 [Patescibacteria group bacterium]|nr:hypothetical protein [Patescibacteria group bacterium]MBU1123267.1 hypothetical protein [Patescibacteria group bacterium]MBU1911109.1 hypothetical protein [Patescibacteria group bacterium]